MLYSELRMIIFIVLPAMSEFILHFKNKSFNLVLFCSLCLLALDWKQLWNDSLLDSLYSSHELESRSMLRKYQFYHHKSLKSNHAFNAIREPQQQRKQKGSIYRGFDADTIFEKRERRPVLSGLRIPKICERQKMTTV